MSRLVNAIITAFNRLGGDPSEAMEAASGRSYNGWVNQQAAYTACSGAAAMAAAGVHLLALPADLAFLMHKMAYCAWGVGTICGCKPAGKEDFAIILALWSGAITKEELFGATGATVVASGAFTTTILPGGNYAIGGAVSKGLPKAVAKGLPKAVGKGASLATGATVGLLAKKVSAVPAAGLATHVISKATGKGAAKLSEKVAVKLAAKIAPKVTAKGVAGFIPFIGAAAVAGVNIWCVRGIADSARTYYTELARQEQRTLS